MCMYDSFTCHWPKRTSKLVCPPPCPLPTGAVKKWQKNSKKEKHTHSRSYYKYRNYTVVWVWSILARVFGVSVVLQDVLCVFV